ncbi:MAG: SDR family NAD(P)-dependent oxidoreductase [Betaproteobacteria bacterium]|jgi:NAD(P)-dependent dehydrogenase (short-subunit alcohol dehydrogenase family)|nr:SDR family NAD(P)-dependent oxidoreductase [Betaproteobacteria bacterium]MDH4292633.1 SDR family NAD(P)-dependent oxidoreductase [Betaproteobacteria bacterium]MDH5343819.1 SDR family NAD(P)-dependent oxidoreductase [Betaproteobacteria bacterium]
MSKEKQEIALIVGAGRGLSASLARLFASQGMRVALAARNTDKLAGLATETGAKAYVCDAADPASVDALFESVTQDMDVPNIVVYNASNRGGRGPVTELDPEAVRNALMITTFGGFLVAQAAAKRMIPAGGGTILLTGASASVKGFPNSSSFAMGKFGLRGLAQSLARELQPQNIHVGHFVIDGGIALLAEVDERAAARGVDGLLNPDAIAQAYLQLHRQHRSAWTWEIELRPWVEKF